MEEQPKKTYRVKAGKVWAHLKAGDTVELTPAEALPYPEELEEVPGDANPTTEAEASPSEPSS